MRSRSLVLGASLALALALPALPVAAADPSPSPAGSPGAGGTTTGLRDMRYCEVIPSVTDGETTTSTVYNTLGLNLCPPLQWAQLTEDEVNAEYGSQSAKLNGPRHWVLDAITATGGGPTTSGETFTFGGIEMGERAVITTPAGQATVGDQLYTPNQVQRNTIWTYDAGTKIYTLTDPDGNVYVMQSYSQIVDKTLTIGQLDDLASKLSLPEGWTYAVETLTDELQLASNGLAYVINDDLYDSYQRR
ncbi:MAG: hypothetical protein U0869_26225 [Chloroflexota bacterium]